MDELRRSVTDSTFTIWLEPLRLVDLEGHSLTVSAPDELRSWVSDRYRPLLERCARSVLSPQATVVVVAPTGASHRPAATPALEPAPPPVVADAPPDQPFNRRLTFDQFVIGDSNRFAHAAALVVAEMPGQAYNPLFICGPPGLGKTHLLHAIANYITQFGTGLSVRYTTAESFTNEFVSAIHYHATDSFKSRFRHNDVLLIDDVQFLESKARTEEEFFHTFNALHDAGAQLVLTSDRPPRDLAALEDRLRERFAAGLVVEVKPPDADTRLAVLRKRAQHDGVQVDDERAFEVIAARISANVRALEGALVRVVAFASLTHRPIDGQLAGEVLDGLYPERRAVGRTLTEIQRAACDAFGITLDELVSPARAARLTWPRQVAMYLSRELTDQTLPAIGRAFGRDHTTVLHAWRRASERIAQDRAAYDLVNQLAERLRRAE